MAQHGEGVRIVLVTDGQDLDRLAVLQRQAQVLRASVRTYEDGLLGELRADRARGVEAGRAGWKFELRVVG